MAPHDILDINKDVVEKKIKDFEKRKRNKELADLKAVLSTPEGKRVAYRFLEKCETFTDAEQEDVNKTYIKIGKQKIGHWFLGEMDVAKQTAYQEMVRERRSAMATEEQIINNIKSGKDQGDS